MDKDQKTTMYLSFSIVVLLLLISFYAGRGWEQARVVNMMDKLDKTQAVINSPLLNWLPQLAAAWEEIGFEVATVKPQDAVNDSTNGD